MQINERELTDENKRLLEENQRLKSALEQKKVYETLFHASPDIIIQVDSNFKVIELNLPNRPVTRSEELRGSDLFDITPPTLHSKMKTALEKVFSKGETVRYESEGEILGKYSYFLNYLTPLKDEQGITYSAYFVSQEITELKTSEKLRRESEEKLMALFGSSQHLHILIDKDQKLLWFNQKAAETSLFVYKKEMQVGSYAKDYISEERQEAFDSYFQRALKGESVLFPRHYVIENDQYYYLEMMLQGVYEDEARTQMIGISLVAIETTDRRANEAKLEKINKELIQHNQQLNQYSFVISHNLRGPIVTLLGLVNLFEQKTTDEAFRDEIIQHIKKSTLHLDSIILDLNLILSQSDGRESMRSEVSFTQEVQMVKDLLKSQIDFAEAHIETDFTSIDVIYSVRSYVQSIIMNLISNSVKYKKPNSPAHIRIHTSKTSDHMVRFEIKDNGLGLNLEKHMDSLYGLYKRFHTHVDGKGLGLHLIKTQVDLLGGRIEVSSAVNEGTTFSVYLPLH